MPAPSGHAMQTCYVQELACQRVPTSRWNSEGSAVTWFPAWLAKPTEGPPRCCRQPLVTEHRTDINTDTCTCTGRHIRVRVRISWVPGRGQEEIHTGITLFVWGMDCTCTGMYTDTHVHTHVYSHQARTWMYKRVHSVHMISTRLFRCKRSQVIHETMWVGSEI